MALPLAWTILIALCVHEPLFPLFSSPCIMQTHAYCALPAPHFPEAHGMSLGDAGGYIPVPKDESTNRGGPTLLLAVGSGIDIPDNCD